MLVPITAEGVVASASAGHGGRRKERRAPKVSRAFRVVRHNRAVPSAARAALGAGSAVAGIVVVALGAFNAAPVAAAVGILFAVRPRRNGPVALVTLIGRKRIERYTRRLQLIVLAHRVVCEKAGEVSCQIPSRREQTRGSSD